MASYGDHLSLLFVVLLFFSPQIHARQGSFFSRFIHYSTNNNVDVTEPKEPISSAPAPAPAPTSISTLAPALAPEALEMTPAPTPLVADEGDAYGLYGRDPTHFSPSEDTPAVNNELLNEDLAGDDSYKTGYPNTRLYSNYDDKYNPTNDNGDGYYTDNFKNDQYSSDNNEKGGYRNNYKGYSYPKVNYNNAFYNNRAETDSHSTYGKNGYQNSERQGMSDTRFLEGGKYYYKGKGENNGVDMYDEPSAGTESTKFGEGHYENNRSPYEFDSMEEYEKQQENEGYVP